MFIIGLFSLNIFLELGEEVSEKSLIVNLDDTILNLIQKCRYVWLDKFLISITHLASWQGIVLVSLIIFLFLISKKYYYHAIEIALVTAGSITTNVLLKNVFNRPRPGGSHSVEVISSSFPSGHAMVGCAVYGFLIYLLLVQLKDKSTKFIFSIFLSLLIFLIGFSRIYLNVHYPSDVIGGYAAGLFWLTFCIGIVHISKFIIERKSKKGKQ
jgi:undecaprenyl-diphosphatase